MENSSDPFAGVLTNRLIVSIGAIVSIIGGAFPWVAEVPNSWGSLYYSGMVSGIETLGIYVILLGFATVFASVLVKNDFYLSAISVGSGLFFVGAPIYICIKLLYIEAVLPGVGIYVSVFGGIALILGGISERIVSFSLIRPGHPNT